MEICFFFVLTVIVNGIAGSTTLIGGQNTAAVSNKYPTLITPAPYVFAIWGVIYFLLGIFVVYQALPKQKENDFIPKISWLFVLSSILNISWIVVWQFEYLTVSVVLIVAYLLSLITIYLRLNIGRGNVKIVEKLTVHLPFSIYLGWLSIATIANITVALVANNWDGFGIAAETWAIIIVAVALVLTLLMLGIRKDIAYALVIIWAFIGISVNQSNANVVLTTQVAVAIATVALLTTVTFMAIKRKGRV
ncbi:MAG: tryptophan-rich sensory protein [Candidatus Bathyarchaeota archaeon]|nr:tryptophan-rich sensory protein [Candidatus Bathyarchaeota archaeon]